MNLDVSELRRLSAVRRARGCSADANNVVCGGKVRAASSHAATAVNERATHAHGALVDESSGASPTH